jgi:hypothetical protein
MNSSKYLLLLKVIIWLSVPTLCEQNGYMTEGIIGKCAGGGTITDERCGGDLSFVLPYAALI